MNAIQNITVGETGRLNRPVGFTIRANLVNIVPFCLSIEIINMIFMAAAMFIALPAAMLILWASTKAQKHLSGAQIAAKVHAGNRLEEYLQGIRVMKAYNLLGDRFIRLRDAFAELRRACIRQEALMGPFILVSTAVVRAGLTFMVLAGSYLLLGGELSVTVFVLFLVVGSRVFNPLTSALTNFAEFRYSQYPEAGFSAL